MNIFKLKTNARTLQYGSIYILILLRFFNLILFDYIACIAVFPNNASLADGFVFLFRVSLSFG